MPVSNHRLSYAATEILVRYQTRRTRDSRTRHALFDSWFSRTKTARRKNSKSAMNTVMGIRLVCSPELQIDQRLNYAQMSTLKNISVKSLALYEIGNDEKLSPTAKKITAYM